MFEGSLVALVTPMTPDGGIDHDAFGALLDHHLSAGTDAVVIGGTTGESPTLEAGELEALIREARAVLGGRIPIIAGSGTNGTAGTVALTERVCRAGADACLLVTPYYNRPTQHGLEAHFRAAADAATKPVMLYNVPGRTACDLLPETVERLSRHANIGALKEAVPDPGRVAWLVEHCGERLAVYSGDDATALEAMIAGARGVVSVTANVVPGAVHEMCELALAGDRTGARMIEERLRPLNEALFVESNPIPVKWAVARLGLIKSGIRLPLTWLSARHEETVSGAMRAAGLQ